jgi:HTH-type transcriptional regulator, sugar sensing transcriptional regulator
VAADPGAAREVWPGQQLSLVVDAREHLLALLSDDLETVHQAVWSNSTFLSCMHHNHVAVEIELTRGDRVRPRRSPASTLLLKARPPGLADLQRRYARPAEVGRVPASRNNPSPGGSR